MRITCVLRSGGEYKPEHAARLHDQAMRHAPRGTAFLCLTDLPHEVAALGVPALSLEEKWPAWWAKLLAMRLPGPNLQLDLDVTIMGDLTPLAEACAQHELIALRDYRGPLRLDRFIGRRLAW